MEYATERDSPLMASIAPSRLDSDGSPASSAISGRILILGGDMQSSAAIGRSLEHQDFATLTVHSLAAAIEVLRTDPPIDAVLFDAGSTAEPISRASDAMLGLAADHPGQSPEPAIMLLVAPDQIPQALEAIQSGVYDYLPKPFSREQLLAAVHRAVEHRRLRMQNDLFRHHLEQLITARTNMLENTMRQLEQSYDVTLEALGNALDLKDAETEGHSKRVTAYTMALGRAMGLNEPQLRVVGRGAFLHDIGKMAIPDAILRKPGKLTRQEQEVMRTHSELGYRMLHKIPYLREASEIVYSHQECYDGSGYPRALRGEQIHIGARIFALADTFDAITSNRPYRQANTMTEARKEVLRCAGTQFDPAIVDVFVATPDSIWQNLREGIMRDGTEFSPFQYLFGEVR